MTDSDIDELFAFLDERSQHLASAYEDEYLRDSDEEARRTAESESE